ncbi:ABC-ATPase domain-containing protein [Kocuria rhizophila]|nr:ABC-ATPase domain-containing protein [Kocuria rhizophila]
MELELEDGSTVSSIGVPEGVSRWSWAAAPQASPQLLQALERGLPPRARRRPRARGDPAECRVRARGGRPGGVRTDVSPFITNLPTGADTRDFGTVQRVRLHVPGGRHGRGGGGGGRRAALDEDTCATNLMVRTSACAPWSRASASPSAPFVDRVTPPVHRARGVLDPGHGQLRGVPGRRGPRDRHARLPCPGRHRPRATGGAGLPAPRRHASRGVLRGDPLPRSRRHLGERHAAAEHGAARRIRCRRGTTPPAGPRHGTARRGGRDNPLALAGSTHPGCGARTWTSLP